MAAFMLYRVNIKYLSLLVLLVLAIFAGCQKQPSPSDSNEQVSAAEPNDVPSDPVPVLDKSIAARVNDVNIMQSQIDEYIEANIQGLRSRPEQLNEEFIQQRVKEIEVEYRDKLIIEQLMDEAVAEQGISITDEEIKEKLTELAEKQTPKMTVEDFLKNVEGSGISLKEYDVMLKRQLAWDKLISRQIEGKYEVTEEQALTYFNEHPNNFGVPELINVSHIVICPVDDTDPNMKAEAKSRAQGLLEKLKQGADFEEMAMDYSEDASGINGGNLGYIAKGKMEPAFEEVAFSLPTGELSDVVETSYGYHIIKVTDHKEQAPATFDMVKEQLISELSAFNKAELTKNYLRKLIQDADIVLNQ